MNEHTPGPWKFDKRAIIGKNAFGGWSEICARVDGQNAEAADANTRLIAAAQDLLAALEWAMYHVENVFALAARHDLERVDLEHARAAVAKART